MEKYFMNSVFESYKFFYLADNQFNIIFMKYPKISTETTFFYKTYAHQLLLSTQQTKYINIKRKYIEKEKFKIKLILNNDRIREDYACAEIGPRLSVMPTA